MAHPSRIVPAHRLRAQAAAKKPKRVRKPKAAPAAQKALVDQLKDGDGQ